MPLIEPILKGKGRLLQNLGWLTFDKFVRITLGLLLAVLTARYLGPKDFGLLNYALSLVMIVGVIADLGLNQITTREIVRQPKRGQELIAATLSLKFVGGIFSVCLIVAIAFLVRSEDALARILIILLSSSLIFKSTDAIKCWFESKVESRYAVWAENTAFLISGTAKVLLILGDYDLIFFAFAIVVESILSACGLVFFYRMKGQSFVFKKIRVETILTLLKESWPLLLSNIAIVIYMRIDLVMLESFAGIREVGIYSAATKISEAWYFIPMILCNTLAPSIIRAQAKDEARYLALLGRLYFYLFWLAIILTGLFFFGSGPLVDLLYGPAYAESAPILAVHFMASIAVYLGVASAQHLLAQNQQKISLYRTTAGGVANIALNLILIPKFGAIGAAMGTTISYYISLLSLLAFKTTRPHCLYIVSAPFMFKKFLSFQRRS